MSGRRLLIVAVVFSSTAQAVIINVPGDQPSIQAGIDAAFDGDEIVVTPRTLIASDDHAGIRAAREALFLGVPWQRCQFYLIQSLRSHLK